MADFDGFSIFGEFEEELTPVVTPKKKEEAKEKAESKKPASKKAEKKPEKKDEKKDIMGYHLKLITPPARVIGLSQEYTITESESVEHFLKRVSETECTEKITNLTLYSVGKDDHDCMVWIPVYAIPSTKKPEDKVKIEWVFEGPGHLYPYDNAEEGETTFEEVCEYVSENILTQDCNFFVNGDVLFCLPAAKASGTITVCDYTIGSEQLESLKKRGICAYENDGAIMFATNKISFGASNMASSSKDKEEEREIELPVDVYASWGQFVIRPEDFDGKKVVTLKEINGYFANRYTVCQNNGASSYYVEEAKRVVLVTKQHTKG